jgi:Beta-lactamase enzyme family
MTRWAVLGLVVAVALAAAPSAEAATGWAARKQATVRWVEGRQGIVSFAFVDDRGLLRGQRKWRAVPSASVLKAMLLVTYLRQRSVRGRPLRRSDRRLLAPMIRRSDNVTATRVLGIVGVRRLYRLASRAHMRHFRLRSPWGMSEITAGDQARFFYRIDRYLPPRHRRYALRLLATVVRSQRWGIPPKVPSGWRIFFKGGWGSGTGRVTHQVALLTNGSRRLSIAVLTEGNPSHLYGTRTIRGIARRLLRTPLPAPPP